MTVQIPRRSVAIPALMFIVLTHAFAQREPRTATQDPPWLKELAPKRIVYAVPGMDRVTVRRDLTYKRVGQSELKMDVYNPPDSARASRLPVVIFTHGGAVPANLSIKPKDWGVFRSYGELIAASGLVGVTFNHRFYTWGSVADSQSDLIDLVAHIRSNADTYGIDKDRVNLWAFSAGGPLLSYAVREAPAYARSLVFYYSIFDLQFLRERIPAAVSDEALKQFSLAHQLAFSAQIPASIFIARAGLDEPALNATTDKFIQVSLSKGVMIDFSNHAKGLHGFDVENNDDRSREIIRRTIEFIKAHNGM